MQTVHVFDLKFGFYVKFSLYIQILRSIGLRLGQDIKKNYIEQAFQIRPWD